MAVVTLEPTDPALSEELSSIPTGTAVGFAEALNTRLGVLAERDALLQARVEKLAGIVGSGWVSGGAVAAGAGLSVTVEALEAVVGSFVATDSQLTVGGLTGSAVNRLWLRQDGTFTVNQSDTAPSGDSHGAALLWGTATTSVSDVTSVSNGRRSAAQARVAVVSADPSSRQSGDIWYRSDLDKLSIDVSGVVKRAPVAFS